MSEWDVVRLKNGLFVRIQEANFKGWDPYDILNCHVIRKIQVSRRLSVILTQVNRLCPLNLRTVMKIDMIHNSKAMALLLAAYLENRSEKNRLKADYVKRWLIREKSDRYREYSIGFTFDIVLEHYVSSRGSPSLIITLFVAYALIRYWEKTRDGDVLNAVLSFRSLIENKLPRFENSESLWYSYNFEKVNEIFNATAKVGKYYSLLFNVFGDSKSAARIEKILNYIAQKQRSDGSWAYGERIHYTDGFHTAFVLEAIWYMLKTVDNSKYEEIFDRGMEHYKQYLFRPNGQPLHYHPVYKPKDVRRYLIETDIRDCAMAIVLFSKTGDIGRARKVLEWTIRNMYDRKKGYFYYYKNRFWTNKIEFIRWQAWMLYALAVLAGAEGSGTK